MMMTIMMISLTGSVQVSDILDEESSLVSLDSAVNYSHLFRDLVRWVKKRESTIAVVMLLYNTLSSKIG